MDDSSYDENTRWYLGSFGSGFNDGGWNLAYDWLRNQDTDVPYSDRPAFVSWWDYGFQALTQGQHPTVADNFQTGIPTAGNMLLSRSQDDTVAMFIIRIGIGDVIHAGDGDYSNAFKNTLLDHLSDEEYEEFHLVTRELTQDLAKERMFEVYEWTEETTNQGILALAQGYVNTDGLKTDNYVWRIYEGEAQLGEDYTSEAQARSVFEDRTANRDVLTQYVDDSTGETFDQSHSISVNRCISGISTVNGLTASKAFGLTAYYDSMIAKLIDTGATREIAIDRTQRALNEFLIEGIKTTIPFQDAIIKNSDFRSGNYNIGWVEEFLNDLK